MPTNRTIIIFMSVIIAAMLVATGGLLLYKDTLTRTGFSASDLKVPAMTYDTSIKTWQVSPTTAIEPSRSLSMQWTMTPVYAGYGGAVELTITNDGPTTVFISGYGVEWLGTNITNWRTDSTNITHGETDQMGMLFFSAPNATGDQSYRINLKLAVMNFAGNAWHDYGIVNGQSKQATIEATATYEDYSMTFNPARYFDKINSLADVDAVAQVANTIKAGSSYNIQEVIDTFDWVREHVEYKDDPQDVWQSSSETLSIGTGDCEDQAILVASIITALGGNARVNLVEGHAFPTVYVGNDPILLFSIDGAVESHYGTALTVYFLKDSTGYWMILDTTGFPYAGGLPTTALPVMQGENAWTFEDSDYLMAIDVMQ